MMASLHVDNRSCCSARIRLIVIAAGLIVAALGGKAASAQQAELQRFEFTEVHMGMSFKLLFYATDQPAANRASAAAFTRIAELNRILSDYVPQSELSRFSAGSPHSVPVRLSEPLWLVLSRSQELARRSDGAFDVTVGPYVRLWRRARREKQMPTDQRLAEARSAVGHRLLELDAAKKSARLLQPSMRLDLGGIAAGYAVDEALAALKRHGIKSALVDASGDVAVSDPPPGKPGWRIGVAPLTADGPASRYLSLANSAVTTAGDAYQFVVLDGKRYSHIVDPRTGLGMTDQSTVVVVAPDCLTADGLDTAVSAMQPAAGLKLVDETPGAAAIILRTNNGMLQTFESSRFKDVPHAK